MCAGGCGGGAPAGLLGQLADGVAQVSSVLADFLSSSGWPGRPSNFSSCEFLPQKESVGCFVLPQIGPRTLILLCFADVQKVTHLSSLVLWAAQ